MQPQRLFLCLALNWELIKVTALQTLSKQGSKCEWYSNICSFINVRQSGEDPQPSSNCARGCQPLKEGIATECTWGKTRT